MQEMQKVTGGLKLPPGLFYAAVAVFIRTPLQI